MGSSRINKLDITIINFLIVLSKLNRKLMFQYFKFFFVVALSHSVVCDSISFKQKKKNLNSGSVIHNNNSRGELKFRRRNRLLFCKCNYFFAYNSTIIIRLIDFKLQLYSSSFHYKFKDFYYVCWISADWLTGWFWVSFSRARV